MIDHPNLISGQCDEIFVMFQRSGIPRNPKTENIFSSRLTGEIFAFSEEMKNGLISLKILLMSPRKLY